MWQSQGELGKRRWQPCPVSVSRGSPDRPPRRRDLGDTRSCREDVPSGIRHRSAGLEGRDPFLFNTLLYFSQPYSLPGTALLYQRKSGPKHTLSSNASGIAALTQKSCYLPQTFPGCPIEPRKLPSYFFRD